ncbi:MAG: hypothetical protein LUG98_00955 [Tannerellaceae bacterium]|nr:hypothetical protein [Tannerellaceae bacterium]
MKKSVCFLITVVCYLAFCVSCNDKDKDVSYVIEGGIFQGDELIIKINGSDMQEMNVTIDPSYGYTSEMWISNVTMEGVTATIPVTAERVTGGLQLQGKAERGVYRVEVKGMLRTDLTPAVLTLEVEYENNSEVVGNWIYKAPHVKLVAKEGILFGEEEDPVPAEEITQMLEQMIETYLPALVDLTFTVTGEMDVVYTSVSRDILVQFPGFTTYFVKEDQCYVSFGGVFQYIIDLLSRSEMTIPSDLAFTYKVEGNTMQFYTTKKGLLSVVQLMNYMIGTVDKFDEHIGDYFIKLMQISHQAEEFELGFELQPRRTN